MTPATDADERTPYRALVRTLHERAVLNSCATLLAWDEETCMPPGGAAHRGDQQALLAGLDHERLLDPRFAELVDAAESEYGSAGDSVEAATVREARRVLERARRLPRTLVEAMARETTLAQDVWQGARAERRFDAFAPMLERVLRLKREEAACLSPHSNRYDALLDQFEPGATTAQLAPMFDALRPRLLALLGDIGTHDTGVPEPFSGDFDIERQRRFGRELAVVLGLDPHVARLDEATHPSSVMIGPGDCRITTRYDRHSLLGGIYAILHEMGHAFYELGLPREHWGTAAGEAHSLGLHESQSRLLENCIGRSRAFQAFLLPLVQQAFTPQLDAVTAEQAYRAVNRVQATLVRVEADEVTYNLHVAIRFDLERALIDGNLPIADLPAAWSDAYAETLGVRPADDREGCLQDGHWAAGLFGYFPTYTLGNLIAAQLYARLRADLCDLDRQLAAGDLAPLRAWLGRNVHRWGTRLSATQLTERVTGEALGADRFVDYLEQKYRALYAG